MSYFFAELLPKDKVFQEQYARAMDLRNDHWADELIDIADDGSDDWFETKFGPKFNKEAAERSKNRGPQVADGEVPAPKKRREGGRYPCGGQGISARLHAEN
jgi:hypothetical protein